MGALNKHWGKSSMSGCAGLQLLEFQNILNSLPYFLILTKPDA